MEAANDYVIANSWAGVKQMTILCSNATPQLFKSLRTLSARFEDQPSDMELLGNLFSWSLCVN